MFTAGPSLAGTGMGGSLESATAVMKDATIEILTCALFHRNCTMGFGNGRERLR